MRPVPGQVVINEILPDPAGSDAGREFVELYNASSRAMPLAGVTFQFANGAEDPYWVARWTGGMADTLAGWGYFLIVDKNWAGPETSDAQVRLSLQNGPDAVRLVQGDQVLDLVGYGPLTDTRFFEGNPVSLEPGKSLSRRPDGGDTGDNAGDFRITEPSAGQPNFVPHELSVISWKSEPPSADHPGETFSIQADLLNTGLEDLAVGVLSLVAGGQKYEARVGEILVDAERTVMWTCVLNSPGSVPLDVECPLESGGEPLRFTLGSLQVGPGELVLNEVQAVPDLGQGEWIELLSTQDHALDLGCFKIRDEDGVWRSLPELRLEAHGLVVLAQDPEALGAWVWGNRENQAPGLIGCPDVGAEFLGLDGWPNLNNTAPATRNFADRVYLADSLGVVIDHLTYSERKGESPGVPLPQNGLSLERLFLKPQDWGRSNWGPCALSTGGTPGCPNSVPVVRPSANPLTLSSMVIDRTAGPVSMGLTVEVPGEGSGFGLQIFNLWGELIRDLGADHQGPGTRVRFWQGKDDHGNSVFPGGYVIVAQIRGDRGHVLSRTRILVGVR